MGNGNVRAFVGEDKLRGYKNAKFPFRWMMMNKCIATVPQIYSRYQVLKITQNSGIWHVISENQKGCLSIVPLSLPKVNSRICFIVNDIVCHNVGPLDRYDIRDPISLF